MDNGNIVADSTSTPPVATVDSVNLLLADAKKYFGADNKRALDLATQALEGSRSIAYSKGEADALLQTGMCNSALRDYAHAMDYYNQALAAYGTLNDKNSEATVYSKMGNVMLYEGKYNEALEQYDRALEIKQLFNEGLSVADLRTNSAIIYGFLGHHVMSLGLHMEALKTFETLADQARIASSCSNIGVIYEAQGNYDDALAMFQRALEIRQERNDPRGVSDLLDNMGLVYRGKQNYERALQVFKSALAMRENIGDEIKIAYSYVNLGDIYKDLKEYELALDYDNKALPLLQKLNDKRGIAQVTISLGEVYFDLEEFDKAHDYLDRGIKLSEDSGIKRLQRQGTMYVTELLEKEKKFEEAYYMYRSFVKLDHELLNAETSRQIAQLNLKKEIEQREKLAAAEKMKSETERIKNAELQKAYKSLDMEKKRSEDLLLNILPLGITEELKKNGKTKARHYEMATVMFADIVNFTSISEEMGAEELVSAIAEYFEAFDNIVGKHGVEKIKTIGDAYLCVGGLPEENTTHPVQVVSAARDFLQAVETLRTARESKGLVSFSFRIGVHTGPLVAGVVGSRKFAYDVWGDTVNTSARMQQQSEANRINLSHNTYELVKDIIPCEYRGEIDAKHKGLLKMYFVTA